jgi:hypothetical protein
VRTSVVVAACLAASVVGAAAEGLGGTYQVSGKNFDGSSYSGTAEIVVTSNTTCRIRWVTGGTTSQGICMRNGSSVAASYRLGNSVGLVIYELKSDGSLEGLWTIADKSGLGSESLTPAR